MDILIEYWWVIPLIIIIFIGLIAASIAESTCPKCNETMFRHPDMEGALKCSKCNFIRIIQR